MYPKKLLKVLVKRYHNTFTCRMLYTACLIIDQSNDDHSMQHNIYQSHTVLRFCTNPVANKFIFSEIVYGCVFVSPVPREAETSARNHVSPVSLEGVGGG